MKDVDYEIEHHFGKKDLLPTEKQIMRGVKIIHVKEKGEFFIEDGIEEDAGRMVNKARSGPSSRWELFEPGRNGRN